MVFTPSFNFGGSTVDIVINDSTDQDLILIQNKGRFLPAQ